MVQGEVEWETGQEAILVCRGGFASLGLSFPTRKME